MLCCLCEIVEKYYMYDVYTICSYVYHSGLQTIPAMGKSLFLKREVKSLQIPDAQALKVESSPAVDRLYRQALECLKSKYD